MWHELRQSRRSQRKEECNMAQQFNTPNQFALTGGNVQISYSTSGFDGKPHLTYREGEHELSFSGDEIRIQETEIGTLVTVTLQIQVDVGGTKLSFLIPNYRHVGEAAQPIETVAIKTHSTGNLV